MRSLVYFLQDIKLSHSIFALPFAAVGLLFAQVGVPSTRQILCLVLCMVTARSFAMGMNRFLDRKVDAANPRTARRFIPVGKLSAMQGLAWSLLAGSVFCITAFQLSSLAGILSFPVLLLLACYSLMKRLSWLTHWYLGFCLGMAPVAVNIALAGTVRPSVLLVGLAVLMWTAGFDILYALQDLEFDRKQGLHSVPARFGAKAALDLSRICFAAMIVSLSFAGALETRGWFYFAGVLLVASILSYEHWLVRDTDEKGHSNNINAAFFNVNAWVSVVFYALAQIDVVVHLH